MKTFFSAFIWSPFGLAALFFFLGPEVPGWADMSPPLPPQIPAGFADANGTLGFFAKDGGGIEAVVLENGERVWTVQSGSWPLFTRYSWLAVAARDEERKDALRIRFLKPADGTLLAESFPITFSGWGNFGPEGQGGESGIAWGTRQGYFHLEAWAPRPQRPGPRASRRAGYLQLRWKAQPMVILGIAPSFPLGPPVTGRVWVDPCTGKVERGRVNPDEPFGVAPPKLPKDWKRGKDSLYWNWSDHGAAWSDKPRPFWIAGGVAGYFCRETQAPFRLRLCRWRPLEPLRPVDIPESGECAPLLALDGRHAVLAGTKDGKNHYRLLDLYFAAQPGAAVELPPFEEGVTWKFSVLGNQLLYVTEVKKPTAGGGTAVERTLVSLDWKQGQVRWRHKLAPRYEDPPVAGLR